jgi:hypothetical protein
MPRRPEPWFRAQVGEYYVCIRGKQHRLGPDKDKAYQRFHELMAHQQGDIVTGSVAEVIEAFMDWTEKNRPKSYLWYQKRINHFYDPVKRLAVAKLRPLHIQKILDEHEWSDAYKAGCITAMKRVFNWAVEQGYVDRSPLHGLKKPDPGRREQTLTQHILDRNSTALEAVPEIGQFGNPPAQTGQDLAQTGPPKCQVHPVGLRCLRRRISSPGDATSADHPRSLVDRQEPAAFPPGTVSAGNSTPAWSTILGA